MMDYFNFKVHLFFFFWKFCGVIVVYRTKFSSFLLGNDLERDSIMKGVLFVFEYSWGG